MAAVCGVGGSHHLAFLRRRQERMSKIYDFENRVAKEAESLWNARGKQLEARKKQREAQNPKLAQIQIIYTITTK